MLLVIEYNQFFFHYYKDIDLLFYFSFLSFSSEKKLEIFVFIPLHNFKFSLMFFLKFCLCYWFWAICLWYVQLYFTLCVFLLDFNGLIKHMLLEFYSYFHFSLSCAVVFVRLQRLWILSF
jgi:hypothetical protein